MRGYFYGWYLKCQSLTQTLAIIPSVHQTGKKRTCSIQFITDNHVWEAKCPGETFYQSGKNMRIGKNRFGKNGVCLLVHTPTLNVSGNLDFCSLSPIKYDIMGPFSFVPLLECRHSVISMRHFVCGDVRINGQTFSFQNSLGYWEGDRGRSFPKRYFWTHCFFHSTSIMLSVADIPLAFWQFNGIIGIILLNGKEYRLATYLGAKAVRVLGGVVQIVQGDMELEVCLLEKAKKPLKAPVNGDMARSIHESAACRARYRFRKAGRIVFDFETDKASVEYEYHH